MSGFKTGLFDAENCAGLDCCFGCFCPCHAYGCLASRAFRNGVDIGCARPLGESQCCDGCFGNACCLHFFFAVFGLPCVPPCFARRSYRTKGLRQPGACTPSGACACVADTFTTCCCSGCVYAQVTFPPPPARSVCHAAVRAPLTSAEHSKCASRLSPLGAAVSPRTRKCSRRSS